MLAPPPRIWPAPPPAHVNGAAAATRYGYSSLAQILPSPQDKGDDQQQSGGVFPDEPVKHRKETKQANSATDWRRKERGRIKTEPGITPCQVQEVTTSSKHEQNGSAIPVGIAVARQRVQQSTPPPLTVLTCEERSTNQVTGWSGAPSHWPYPAVDQSLPVQIPPLLGRDPISGQILILPESMQRTVLWPGGSTTGASNQPPPLVMPGPQPVLLSDRYVTLAPPPSSASSGHHHHHHQEKRRSHDHSATTIHGSSSGGLAVGLFPQPPTQAPFLMMPFSHQNNSLLLSTHLTEHNLNTMVVTNHQLSESAVLNPMEVITNPVDGFGGGSMIQQLPPSVVISHTETNSFVRSDINAMYPPQPQEQTQVSQAPPSTIQQEQIVVKEEVEHIDETTEEEIPEEEVKTEVMDASNQTESPVEEDSEGEEEVVVKVEDKACTTVEEIPQEPDISGLELLCSIAQYEKSSSGEEMFKPPSPDVPQQCENKMEDDDWEDESIQEGMKCGLGLLCTVAERCLEEEVVDQKIDEVQPFSSILINPVHDDNDNKGEKEYEELSETDNLSNDCENEIEKEIKVSIIQEKKGEWSTERGKDKLKLKITRRPGRPKKKIKTRKRRSPNQREPPVLQPWSASPDGATSPLASPPTLTPHKRKLSHDLSQESDEGSNSSGGHPPPLSPACSSPSSSKKRKVGRPKKIGNETPTKTELIVTKSVPSNKAIGRILANKPGASNLAPVSSPPTPPPLPAAGSQNKIKPKLKAEAKVKLWHDDEELDLSPGKENGLDDDPLPSRSPVWKSSPKPIAVSLSPPRKPKIKILKKVKKEEAAAVKSPDIEAEKPADLLPASKSPQLIVKSSQRAAIKSTPAPLLKLHQRHDVKSPQHIPSPQHSPKEERSLSQVPDCKLTEEQLKSPPCRILSISNGQFYPGEVTKIIAPDIYEVHIYKERCRKPQILCREEILCSSVAEIHCPEDMFIPSGTRVCAYWSQQYSCFYPGRVVSDSVCGQVPIDFDDGDNGTIERTSVRFLPQDYPIVEPPNTLGKRKRYNSTTSSDSQKNNDATENSIEPENISTPVSEADNKLESVTAEISEAVKEEIKEEISLDEAEKNSVIDGEGADEIMSVLQNFFQSEKEEALEIKRRNRHGDRIHKHHKHHKHRGVCKTHKCKHKHLRSRKHKHSRDESRRRDMEPNSSTDRSSDSPIITNSSCTKDSEDQEKDKDEEHSVNGTVCLANTSKSKIAAFLPEKHEMWSWVGIGVKKGRPLGPRGKGLRFCYKAIQRGKEVISVGDCAVFVSTGRPDRPFIGHIESFWQYQMKKNMTVRVSWFYHPEETIGCPDKLPYPGGLFRSSHLDNNDVQTISHRCEVLPYTQFHEKAETIPGFLDTVYENHETYYLAGRYEPSAAKLDLEPEVEAVCDETAAKEEKKNP